jgi:hypothetical protein
VCDVLCKKFNKMSLSDNNDIFTTQTTLLTSSMLSSVIESSSSTSSLLTNVTDSGDEIYSNDSFMSNDTLNMSAREYVFDRKDVRYVFITLYSLVFCFCFFGEYKWGEIFIEMFFMMSGIYGRFNVDHGDVIELSRMCWNFVIFYLNFFLKNTQEKV